MPNKSVTVHLSRNAETALNALTSPLTVELEIYFSCLIRLRVVFPDHPQADYIPLKSEHDNLNLYFHPIMTKHCEVSELHGRDPDTETFPIKKPEKFIPKWLKLDFKNNQWIGEFGYSPGNTLLCLDPLIGRYSFECILLLQALTEICHPK